MHRVQHDQQSAARATMRGKAGLLRRPTGLTNRATCHDRHPAANQGRKGQPTRQQRSHSAPARVAQSTSPSLPSTEAASRRGLQRERSWRAPQISEPWRTKPQVDRIVHRRRARPPHPDLLNVRPVRPSGGRRPAERATPTRGSIECPAATGKDGTYEGGRSRRPQGPAVTDATETAVLRPSSAKNVVTELASMFPRPRRSRSVGGQRPLRHRGCREPL